MDKKSIFLYLIPIFAAWGFLNFTGIALATNYPDSGLTCDKTSGKVLCRKDYYDPYHAMNVYFKIPKETSDQFPPDANDWAGGEGAEFRSAVVYVRGKALLQNNCVGGFIITERANDNMCGQTNGAKKICRDFAGNLGGICINGCIPTFFYLNVEIPSCPPLDSGIKLSASSEQINEGEKYTINWSTANPDATCQLAGKMPDNYSASSANGSNTFFKVPRGIYIHNFTCKGVLNGANSTAIGQITKTAVVRVGDIQPKIDLKVEPNVITRGESATLSWSSKDAISVSIDQGIGAAEQGSIKISPESTTKYTITGLEEFTGLRLNPKSITLQVIPYPPPKVSLKVEPGVIKKGESATLSWSSENAFSISINQGIGVVPSQGSLKVSPGLTTRYTITGSGKFADLGLAQESVTVRVPAPTLKTPIEEVPIEETPQAPPPPPKPEEKPKVDLKINGKDGPLAFGSPAQLTLSWNLNQYCLAYGSWIGVKNKAGSEQRTVTKPGTYTYKLYCPTIGSDEVTVAVSGSGAAAIPLPIAEASASTDGKNFSQSIRVIRGEATQVWIGAAYDTTKDKKVSRDETGKWTELMSNGGRCEYNLDLNQGNPTFEAAVPDPKNPEACTVSIGKLTFYDKPGIYRYGVLRLIQNNGKVSNVGYINIAVNEPPPPKGPPIIDLRINNLPGPAVALGAPAEYDISWNAQNADSCSASESWNGDKFPAGSQHFAASEKKEFVYTLTCTGKLGTAKQSINLKVAELPVCDFSALPLTIDKNSPFNRQSALTWKCQFANTCSISPAVGNVETFGSVRVSPKETTKYSLTCQNLEGSSGFEQIVEVK